MFGIGSKTTSRVQWQALHAFRTHHGKAPFSSYAWREGNSSRSNDLNRNCHMISRCSLPLFQNPSTSARNFNGEKAHFSSFACERRAGSVFSQPQKFSIYLKRNFSTSNNNMSANGKGPGLIVFDLDCTLWPFHVDTTVNPPFVKTDSKITDQDGKVLTYFPEVPQVLEYLKNEGYSVGVASRTTKPPGAYQLLEFFDWNKYISYREIYPGCKVTHFNKFAEDTKLKHDQMLFFDDEERNIIDMEKEGVKCVLVKNGVDLQLVKDSIDQFKKGKL